MLIATAAPTGIGGEARWCLRRQLPNLPLRRWVAAGMGFAITNGDSRRCDQSFSPFWPSAPSSRHASVLIGKSGRVRPEPRSGLIRSI
jgi:hypothetical protein